MLESRDGLRVLVGVGVRGETRSAGRLGAALHRTRVAYRATPRYARRLCRLYIYIYDNDSYDSVVYIFIYVYLSIYLSLSLSISLSIYIYII